MYACGRQKKLTMPAYCVAANCNNLQMTPGITMHELLRRRPTVRGENRLSLYNSNQLTFLLCRITPICVASTSLQFRTPHGILHGVCFEADTMFRYSFKILPDKFKLIQLYPCGSLGQSISFVFGA